MTGQRTWTLLPARGSIQWVCFPVKQKQVELDDLNLKLNYTQKYSEALHGDVKAKKNFNQKTRTQKKAAEEQKLQQVMSRLRVELQSHTGVGFRAAGLNICLCHQDLYVERLTKELEKVTEQIKMYEVQIIAQSEKKERANNTKSEVNIPALTMNTTPVGTTGEMMSQCPFYF